MCIHGFKVFNMYYLIGLQKDCSNLYFHHPANTGHLKQLAKLITKDHCAILFYIFLISSDVCTIFLLKYISGVTSGIDSKSILRKKPRFQDYRPSVGHANLPTIFQGCFVRQF